MGSFRWENVEQFVGLTHILSLRNGGQIWPKVEKDDGDTDVEEDGDSDRTAMLTNGEDELKRRLLDRLAEAMSCDKGGKDVTCVALQQVAEDRIVLLVARNDAFKGVHRKFCSTLEKLLIGIASAVEHAESKKLKDALWQELLLYSKHRLDHYVNNLQENLGEFKEVNQSPESIPFDNEATKFCDDADIGHYSEATHDAYMKFAKSKINELDDILRSGDRLTRRRLLAEKTYPMRHMSSVEIFINSCPKASLAHKLIVNIRFLGRLRSCYSTILEAAKNIAGFCNTSILLVSNPRPRISPSPLPSLADVLKYVGLSLDRDSVRKFINPKLTVETTEKEFGKCQRNHRGKPLHTHVEAQLILHLAKTITIERRTSEIFPYIGCSKLSCFLCYIFLQSFHSGSAPFRTRGCHGHLYTQWSIPDTNGLQEGMDMEFDLALKNMRNLVAREVVKPIQSYIGQVAESSAAMTVSHLSRSSYGQWYHNKEITAQTNFDFYRRFLDAGPHKEGLHEAERDKQSRSRDIPPAKASKTCGKCNNCHRETSRKCRKCGRLWFCSEKCEDDNNNPDHLFMCAIGRPLDTADYLYRACWDNEFPEDEETLEDFGFSNFPSAYDQSKLLGLYIGLLLHMKVSHRELRRWQQEGTLTANIKSKYEEIPAGYRGGYYPWFLENLQVFQGENGARDIFEAALPYLDPEDDPRNLEPQAKRLSFLLYGMLLNGYHPNPTQTEEVIQTLYFTFGFCTGCGSQGEQELPRLYRTLISRCSFKEFWTAYESNSLISLFDAYRLSAERKRINHLDTFLNRNSCEAPTVWRLRTFTQSTNTYPPHYLAVDYGFFNCDTVEERSALKNVYKDLLECPRADPMELHAACIKGKLYDFAKEYLPRLEQRFVRLMKNPYPLPIID
ncbi:hypothetical protein F5I97DRAFT_1311550 [Phlebopus sp. FC_14]|nr:hypothetical protein F5I97DRAFT_1311550 [Phlebopus sp. FC_14]